MERIKSLSLAGLLLRREVAEAVTNECALGTDLCVEEALCEQSALYDGYTCLCPAGQIGNGFAPGFGGDGCTDTCDMFEVDCANAFFELTLNKACSGVSAHLKDLPV